MTDHFEEAKDEILRKARANGGITVDHLFDALIATNADLDEQHKETRDWHDKVSGMVFDHIAEANVRDERLDALERWREEQATHCEERILKLITAEHDDRHERHMAECHLPRRSTDPPNEDHSDERRGLTAVVIDPDEEIGDMRRAWRIVRWAVAAFVLPIIATAGYYVGRLIFN